MTQSLVKLTIDLYAPGAVLSPQAFKWLGKWDDFHTRRILFPVQPLRTLTVLNSSGEEVVASDFCHIRLTSMDGSYNGLLDSKLDVILSDTRLDFFLGNELATIAEEALVKAPPYRQGRAYASWIELWTFDDQHLQQRDKISFQQILDTTKQKTP